MTKLKMGVHNRITPERFTAIKAALAEGLSEDAVMAKYEIKHTTLRYIQRSLNFYEYRLLTETLPAARKMPKVIEPTSGVAYEDFSYRKKKQAPTVNHDNYHHKGQTGVLYIIMIITGIAITAIVALAALGVLANVNN